MLEYDRIDMSVGIQVKGAAMQIEKALINDRLRVSKMYSGFHITTICNFAVIYLWNLKFS